MAVKKATTKSKKSTFPDKIDIHGITYSVSKVPVLKKGEDGFTWGCINHLNQTIKLDADISKEKAVVVLMHEVLHGCVAEYRIDTYDHEEDIVGSLAPAIAATLRNNPDLVKLFL